MTKFLKWIGVILAIAAFCMAFTNQVILSAGSAASSEIGFQDVFFSEDVGGTTIVPFIGYCMILLGGLFALVSSLLTEKLGKITIDVVGAIVALAGSILVVCMPQLYSEANAGIKFLVQIGAELSLTATSIIAVLGGFVVAGLLVISFVFDLLKRNKR